MQTLRNLEDQLDALEPQPDSWLIDAGIMIAAAMIVAMVVGGAL